MIVYDSLLHQVAKTILKWIRARGVGWEDTENKNVQILGRPLPTPPLR